jgi:hypothetical protein
MMMLLLLLLLLLHLELSFSLSSLFLRDTCMMDGCMYGLFI